MATYYTKLFQSILDSTIWHESLPTKVVWITMMAMSDRDGCVWASLPGLADRAKVTREECETALAKFFEVDPDSRTREHEGRRIEKIDGGWRLLNHAKYRAMMSTEDRREYNRVKQSEYRAKKKVQNTPMSGETAAVKAAQDGHLDPNTFEPNPPTEGLGEDEKVADMKQSHKVPTKPITQWDQREQEDNQEQVTAQYPPSDVPAAPPLSTFKKVNLTPISPSQKHPAAAPSTTPPGPPPGLIPNI